MYHPPKDVKVWADKITSHVKHFKPTDVTEILSIASSLNPSEGRDNVIRSCLEKIHNDLQVFDPDCKSDLFSVLPNLPFDPSDQFMTDLMDACIARMKEFSCNDLIRIINGIAVSKKKNMISNNKRFLVAWAVNVCAKMAEFNHSQLMTIHIALTRVNFNPGKFYWKRWCEEMMKAPVHEFSPHRFSEALVGFHLLGQKPSEQFVEYWLTMVMNSLEELDIISVSNIIFVIGDDMYNVPPAQVERLYQHFMTLEQRAKYVPNVVYGVAMQLRNTYDDFIRGYIGECCMYAEEMLPTYTPKALSRFIYALGMLKYTVRDDFFRNIAESITTTIKDFDGHELAMTLEGVAHMTNSPSEGFIMDICKELPQRLDTCYTNDFFRILNGLNLLRWKPTEQFFKKWCDTFEWSHMNSATCVELSNICFALGQSVAKPATAFMSKLVDTIRLKISSFDVLQLLNIISGVTMVDYTPSIDFINKWCSCIEPHILGMDSVNFSLILYNLGLCHFTPSKEFTRLLTQKLKSVICEYTISNLANIIHSLTLMTIEPDKDLFTLWLYECTRKMGSIKLDDMKKIVMALTKINHSLSPKFTNKLLVASSEKLNECLSVSSQNALMSTLINLGFQVTPDMKKEWMMSVIHKRLNTITEQELVTMLDILANNKPARRESVIRVWCNELAPVLKDVAPSGLIAILGALEVHQYQPSDQFMDAWCQAVCRKTASMSDHQIKEVVHILEDMKRVVSHIFTDTWSKLIKERLSRFKDVELYTILIRMNTISGDPEFYKKWFSSLTLNFSSEENLSCVLSAMYMTKFKPPSSWFDEYLEKLTKFPIIPKAGISNSICGLSLLDVQIPEKYLRRLYEDIVITIDEFTVKELMIVLYAVAESNLACPNNDVLLLVADKLISNVGQLEAYKLPNLLETLVKLGLRPTPDMLLNLCRHIITVVGSMGKESIMLVQKSLGTLTARLDVHLLESWFEITSKYLHKMSGRDLMNLLYVIILIGLRPSDVFVAKWVNTVSLRQEELSVADTNMCNMFTRAFFREK